MSKLTQQKELKQTLQMNTMMQQSIKMLQMSSVELQSFAAQELAKNPFLEDCSLTAEDYTPKEQMPLKRLSASSVSRNTVDNSFFANIAAEKTLRSHLEEQINIEIPSSTRRMIAYYLLDYLQSNGYLSFDINEAAINLQCSRGLISAVLASLQKLDPPGIFARNVKECLKIQLEDKGINDKRLLILVDNLELLANGDLKKLMKICHANQEQLKKLIAEIKKLNPKPANGFLDSETQFKIPDVILTIEREQAKLEINPEAMPNLRLNHEYYLDLKPTIKGKADKEFAKKELEAANSIIRAIDQRARTILQVAVAIVEEQIDFFKRGVMYLKPLTLSRIAEITQFNESTISRSTANKYLVAPSGIYELKYFFSSSLNNAKNSTSDVSSTKAKELIKQMIFEEQADNILSDEEIAAELKKFHIDVARRTIAKYREALGLPTSAVRKRQKHMAWNA